MGNRGHPAPPKKGAQPQFSVHVYCGQAAVCIGIPLGTEVGLSLDDVVLDRNTAKGAQPSNRRSIAAYYGIDLSTSKGWVVSDIAVFVLRRDVILQPTNRWRDERLSWPGWFTCNRQFTHLSGEPSTTGRAHDGKFAGQRPTLYRCATQPTTLSHSSECLCHACQSAATRVISHLAVVHTGLLIYINWYCERDGDGAGNTIEENSSIFSVIRMRELPSVLWHCWLGGRKGIRPAKKYGGMVEVRTG